MASVPLASESTTGKFQLMRVSAKGQVTIPRELRDEFGIGAGTEVVFERRPDGLIVRKADNAKSRGQMVVERLRGRGDVQMTTDGIMALTRSVDD